MLKRNEVKTIGIVAPASCEDSAIINEKLTYLKSLGFNLVEGNHIYDRYGYLAGYDKDRANDLNNMFKNSDIDAILCLRGGYGSIRMAKHLDFNSIRSNPKPFCGYSDITLLLNYISTKCKFPTFHCAMANSNLKDNDTLNSFLNLMKNKSNSFNYDTKCLNCDVLNSKDFTGSLVGGNLSIICSTIGTPYEIKFNECILFIEDIDEAPYSIDRMLNQLIYSQKLRTCKGIIVGNFKNCGLNDYSKSFSVDEIINQLLLPYNIPIIKNFPAGHDYPNLVLPIGSKVKFNSKSGLLSFKI